MCIVFSTPVAQTNPLMFGRRSVGERRPEGVPKTRSRSSTWLRLAVRAALLSIRRSLVQAQVEEPIKSKGYVAKRNPFLFAILESGQRQLRDFALTHRDSETVLEAI
jgi:hypothetical protein